MKRTQLLLAFTFSSLTLMASSPTDYFRSAATGDWNSPATWESSPTGVEGSWGMSDLYPTNSTLGNITIRSGNTVTLDGATTATNLTIDAGGVLVHPKDISFTVFDGTADDDFVINGRYELNGTMPLYSGSAPKVSVANTGEVRVNSNDGGQSDNFARDMHVYFNSGLFDWKIPLAFASDAATYFPNATATDKAVFRIDANVGFVGANTSTTINGMFEVASGYSITFQNDGAKIFRDGLGGAGTIVQASDSGPFQITSATGVIDGTLTMTLQQSTGNALEIPPGAWVNISGSPTMTVGTATNPGATLFIGGALTHNGALPINIANGSLVMSGQGVGNKAILGGLGTFTGSITAAVIMSQFATATIYFSSTGTNNYVKTLTIGTQGTLTLGNALNISPGTAYGTVTVTSNGILNSNDFLTLKSDANGTARVAQGPINGNVTQERYIPAKRTWRFLHGGPFSMSPQTLNVAWQEGYTNATLDCSLNGGTPGYGTMLIYDGQNGYDLNPLKIPSIKVFAAGGSAYAPPPSTTGVNIMDYEGYMVFIFGDRRICISQGVSAGATPTTLRSTGSINAGTITKTFSGLTIGDFVAIGNPYASSIDVTQPLLTATGSAHSVWIFDPDSYGTYGYGAWVLASGTTIVPAGGTAHYPTAASARIIQSGQAFAVQATATTMTITFHESDKTTSTSSAVFGRSIPSMNINLSAISGTAAQVIDGVAIVLDSSKESGARKFMNETGNVYLQKAGQKLSIESRVLSPSKRDTFFVEMTGMSPRQYALNFTQDVFGEKVDIRLVDRFTKTDTAISNSSNYAFTVTGDTNSYKHRFMIVMSPVVSVSPTEVIGTAGIYPNPVGDVFTITGLPSVTGPASIIDVVGRVIRNISIVSSRGDCSFLESGIYFLRFRFRGNEKIIKFSKL